MTRPASRMMRRRRRTGSAAVSAVHGLVGLTVAALLATHVASEGLVAPAGLMAAVLAGLAASGLAEFLGGQQRDRDF